MLSLQTEQLLIRKMMSDGAGSEEARPSNRGNGSPGQYCSALMLSGRLDIGARPKKYQAHETTTSTAHAIIARFSSLSTPGVRASDVVAIAFVRATRTDDRHVAPGVADLGEGD